MRLGGMNNPSLNLASEAARIADLGLDFIDLTVEYPAAHYTTVDPKRIRELLASLGLSVVGHTSPLLPIGSPIEGIRDAAVREIAASMQFLTEVGARMITVHLDGEHLLAPSAAIIDANAHSLSELANIADRAGAFLVVEHYSGIFSTVEGIESILELEPRVGLHLDVGHAVAFGSMHTAAEMIRKFSERLHHVHFSDNLGDGVDSHLPIGAGTIDWGRIVELLKRHGYDETITLEVFSPHAELIEASRSIIHGLWSGTM